MAETTQPGVRLDADTWQRFRQFVQDRHGGVRGNLRSELEAAIENHINASRGPDELERIEDDVATIKAMLVEGQSDGGVPAPTPQTGEDTHARQRSKPEPNEPRSKKIQYLLTEIENDPAVDESGGELTEAEIRNTIRSEYGFKQQTEDEYFELICDELDAVTHPLHGKTMVWGKKAEEAREAVEQEAADTMDTVSE